MQCSPLFLLTLLQLQLALGALVALPAAAGGLDSKVQNAWVQIVPPNRGQVRVLTEADRCPEVRFDGEAVPMNVRARSTSDFDVLVCQKMVPEGTRRIRVAGRDLNLVVARPQRIAIVGDTGCRMKAGDALDDGFQNCGDPDDWEFAKVAQRVAEWEPDLIIQLGDYIYREQECPEDCGNCKNSPWNSPGLRLETWNAEFFEPGRPMLEAAPLVFVRGDHEKCERAGGGYVRFLDPFAVRACTDFGEPYLLDFEGLPLVVMDTVQADDTSLSPDVVISRYASDFERAARIAKPGSWLMSHRPLWALRPTQRNDRRRVKTDECGNQRIPKMTVETINATTQEALGASRLAGVLPKAIDLVLTAHIHVGEVLSFTGRRPPQMVVGISGTKLLPAVTDGLVGTEIDGETVTHATMVSVHGFFGFEKQQNRDWSIEIVDAEGAEVTTCGLGDKEAICREP